MKKRIIKPKIKTKGFLQPKIKIKIIGIGGGGSSIVQEIAPRINRGEFIIANTDAQDLRQAVSGVKRFQFGEGLTQGLGTGMNPKLGEICAKGENDQIRKLLKGADLCILISCLGGGTGSGASPVFANIAKRLKIVTFGIFTLPFDFEGKRRMQIAQQSLKELSLNLDSISIIPNQRIFRVVETNTPLQDALSRVNMVLAKNFEGLMDLIYSPGLINIDFADFRAVISGRRKLAYFNSGQVQGKKRAEKVVKTVLHSPLYRYNTKNAERILFNISGGKDLSMGEIEEISSAISDSNHRARIIFGVSQASGSRKNIGLTLLAVGCEKSVVPSTLVSKNLEQRNKKTEKQKNKEIKKQRNTRAEEQRNREAEKPKDKETGKQRNQGIEEQRDIETKKPRDKEIEEQRDAGTEKLKNRETEKPKDRKTEGPKDRKTEKSKDRKTEKSKEKEAKKPRDKKAKKQKNREIEKPKKKEVKGSRAKKPKPRRNGLDLKREIEEEEKRRLAKEKKWDIPAFLRRGNT